MCFGCCSGPRWYWFFRFFRICDARACRRFLPLQWKEDFEGFLREGALFPGAPENSIRTMACTQNSTSRLRVLSGMRPTGKLHLGNYMGALANWVKLQNDAVRLLFLYRRLACADDGLRRSEPDRTEHIQVMLDYLAAGLDPERSVLFLQSRVLQHAELALLLGMSTPLGWLERVPSYKEMQENLTNRDLTTYGFLGYPVLMAADILALPGGFCTGGTGPAGARGIDARGGAAIQPVLPSWVSAKCCPSRKCC